MNGVINPEADDYSEFVEVDPTGRYGRYNEILGKGASKTVYRAFDEYEGIEVAWNQVKLYDFLQSPEDLERLYCEIHLLKTMKHNNIMKFYTSWVDTANRNINFVTEMFTSGTLRQYRQKHKRVNIRAVKHWCRQILRGLLYLHSHDPPVIHRDLKCDNIFVNGNQGEVKIGDLGLAAILRKSHAAHCVGTPEFMAPEVYEEEYNELVDIYSFGMCILEMVTFEYPYSECTHPAQIYKKVISGKKPDALYKVKDPEVREFVEKCLASVSLRLSARELLQDPFLRIDDCESDLRPIECRREPDDMMEPTGIELFEYHEDEHPANVDISIKGKRREDDGIFLRLRIADKEDHIRNIYFPFDIEMDTALSVATEMVAELDITDQDVTKIADMIDGEIASLVPEWKPGPGIEETPCFATLNLCAKNLQIFQCSNGCAAMHGRFEEITYQVDGADHHIPEGQSEELHYDYENEIQQVLRWLKAKHQMEMRGLRDLQLGFASKPSSLDNRQLKPDNEGLFSTLSNTSQGHNNGLFLKSSAYDKHFTSNCATQVNKCSPDLVTHGARNCEANKGSRSAEDMVHVVTAKSFYTAGSLLPCPIHRTMSLPVDAVDI
ncbi:unnamed protein product, partial [Vitis vinifera]